MKVNDICLILLITLAFGNYSVAHAQDSIRTDTIAEIAVTAQLIKQTPDGNQYLITEKMRSMGVNSYELLAHIPGIQLNRASNQIIINNKSNILFLVNGRPQSKEYIILNSATL